MEGAHCVALVDEILPLVGRRKQPCHLRVLAQRGSVQESLLRQHCGQRYMSNDAGIGEPGRSRTALGSSALASPLDVLQPITKTGWHTVIDK